MIAAGTLNRRITFLQGVKVADGDGGYVPPEGGWTPIGTVPDVWGNLEPLRGAELVSAQQQHADARYRVTTRWRSDLLTTYGLSLLNGTVLQYFLIVAALPRRTEGILLLDVREAKAVELGL
jgi:head-tail adaptor